MAVASNPLGRQDLRRRGVPGAIRRSDDRRRREGHRTPLEHGRRRHREDVDAAVAAANAAQPDWAATPYDERAAVSAPRAVALQERADEITDLIVRETGSIPGKAAYEVGGAAERAVRGGRRSPRAPSAEILPSHSPTRVSIAERVPCGVVGAITPWNFPLILGMRVVAPALALGNTVVLKPSPETPLSGGMLIAALLADAGLPAGALNVVTGDQEIGERIVGHPGTSMIHFTGSSAVGSRIAEVAGKQLKRVSLELGGNNALLVLDDADLEQAAMIGAWSAWHYQGQTCITAGRHIVARNLYEPYVEALAAKAAAIAVGDPTQDGIGLGPMINERQRDRAHAFLSDSVAQGANVVEGGTLRRAVLPADGREPDPRRTCRCGRRRSSPRSHRSCRSTRTRRGSGSSTTRRTALSTPS